MRLHLGQRGADFFIQRLRLLRVQRREMRGQQRGFGQMHDPGGLVGVGDQGQFDGAENGRGAALGHDGDGGAGGEFLPTRPFDRLRLVDRDAGAVARNRVRPRCGGGGLGGEGFGWLLGQHRGREKCEYGQQD